MAIWGRSRRIPATIRGKRSAASSTPLLWGSGTPVASPGGTFTSGGTTPANATGVNDSLLATWGSTVANDTASLTVEGFNAQAAIGQPAPIGLLSVTVHQWTSNASRVVSATAQLTDNGVPFGTPQNLTITSTAGNFDTLAFGGVTWAQLANLGVKITYVRYNDVLVSNQSVDAVSIQVAYGPAPLP